MYCLLNIVKLFLCGLVGGFPWARKEGPHGPWESQEEAWRRSETGPGVLDGPGEWQAAVWWEDQEVHLKYKQLLNHSLRTDRLIHLLIYMFYFKQEGLWDKPTSQQNWRWTGIGCSASEENQRTPGELSVLHTTLNKIHGIDSLSSELHVLSK